MSETEWIDTLEHDHSPNNLHLMAFVLSLLNVLIFLETVLLSNECHHSWEFIFGGKLHPFVTYPQMVLCPLLSIKLWNASVTLGLTMNLTFGNKSLHTNCLMVNFIASLLLWCFTILLTVVNSLSFFFLEVVTCVAAGTSSSSSMLLLLTWTSLMGEPLGDGVLHLEEVLLILELLVSLLFKSLLFVGNWNFWTLLFFCLLMSFFEGLSFLFGAMVLWFDKGCLSGMWVNVGMVTQIMTVYFWLIFG